MNDTYSIGYVLKFAAQCLAAAVLIVLVLV
jgi:hypothetical protein